MKRKNPGHWFCDHCDDVVFMAYESNIPGEMFACPVCGVKACHYVADKITRKQLGEKWFEKMKQSIADSDTTPLI